MMMKNHAWHEKHKVLIATKRLASILFSKDSKTKRKNLPATLPAKEKEGSKRGLGWTQIVQAFINLARIIYTCKGNLSKPGQSIEI
ncbi:hypothetical protein H5410_050694 [Solanum commersonii]|uniref:Uncharacterized protein n=1 Tax=Solanum commersonii TaxID=4109 RepID=A0A9J5WW79_SOLCO|nr:hypothetical protein H5410_050694 [Solanum commersonii]